MGSVTVSVGVRDTFCVADVVNATVTDSDDVSERVSVSWSVCVSVLEAVSALEKVPVREAMDDGEWVGGGVSVSDMLYVSETDLDLAASDADHVMDPESPVPVLAYVRDAEKDRLRERVGDGDCETVAEPVLSSDHDLVLEPVSVAVADAALLNEAERSWEPTEKLVEAVSSAVGVGDRERDADATLETETDAECDSRLHSHS